MLKVGTVCYLTGDHSFAGQCCTVIGPLTFFPVFHSRRTNMDFPGGYAHMIELASGWTWPFGVIALPSQLIPIAPPGMTDDTPATERVPA